MWLFQMIIALFFFWLYRAYADAVRAFYSGSAA